MKYDLTITPTPEKAEVSVTMREDHGADIYDITITSDEPVTGVKINFHIPAGDIAGRWFPRMKMFDKGVHNSWEGATWTNFTGGAPLVSFYRSDDRNRLTAALSDCKASWALNIGRNASSSSQRRGKYQYRLNRTNTRCRCSLTHRPKVRRLSVQNCAI